MALFLLLIAGYAVRGPRRNKPMQVGRPLARSSAKNRTIAVRRLQPCRRESLDELSGKPGTVHLLTVPKLSPLRTLTSVTVTSKSNRQQHAKPDAFTGRADSSPSRSSTTPSSLPLESPIRQRLSPKSRWRSPPAARLNTCDDRPTPRTDASSSAGDAARVPGITRGGRFGPRAATRRGA